MSTGKKLIIEPCSFEVGVSELSGVDAHCICHTGYILRGGWTENMVQAVFNNSNFGEEVKVTCLGRTGYYVRFGNKYGVAISSQRALNTLISELKRNNLTAVVSFSESRIIRELHCNNYTALFHDSLLRKLLHLYINALKPSFETYELPIKLETTFTLCYYPHSGAWADGWYRIVLRQTQSERKKK